MAWSEKDLQNLKDKGFLIDDRTNSNSGEIAPIKPKKKIEKISVEKNTIAFVLMSFKQKGMISNFVTEHQFDSMRKFRFDWAVIDLKLAIEYEGVISEKSRHTSLGGFSNDCTKYNLAIANGWRVLRYTALNYQNLEEDLNKILNQ